MTAALRAAEAEVAAFRERNGMLGTVSDTSNPESVSQQQLQEVTAQLATANLARINEERRLARVQELLRSGQLPSAIDLQSSPLIATLLEREAIARRELGEKQASFGSRHPSVIEARAGIADLRARIDAETRRTVQVIAGDLSAARATEADLGRRLEELKRTLLDNKPNEGELRVLLRGVQMIRERLATLERSYDQALAVRDLRPIAASLILPAEPEGIPVFPRPFLVLASACWAASASAPRAPCCWSAATRACAPAATCRPRPAPAAWRWCRRSNCPSSPAPRSEAGATRRSRSRSTPPAPGPDCSTRRMAAAPCW
jgi:succinoglycan biosynthesis transport protein ExoP